MQIVEFLRSRPSLLIIGVAIVLLASGLIPACRTKKRPPQSSLPTTSTTNVQISIVRPVPSVVAIAPRAESARTNRQPVIYSVHIDLPPETNATTRTDVAPFGRLLQCQLVNTLESLAPNTPIIGLVTEPLWHLGQPLIPAGAEVHAPAQLDRTRERITSSGPWIIVFPSGEQLSVTGIALDREFDQTGAGWGITDGSAGIRGDLLRNGTLPEIKLFLATALSGMARGFQQPRATILGDVLSGTARNAGLSGSAQAIDAYAHRILEGMQRDGLYVRVPAGKQFYVYITEPLDRSKARTGAMPAISSTPASSR